MTKHERSRAVATRERGEAPEARRVAGTGGERGAERDGRAAFRAPVDILENEREIVVLLDAPGATSDEIDIRYEDGMLTVHAPVEPRETPGATQLLREYGVGDFRRTFRVGQDIDVKNIGASYENGVLRLLLPRTEASRPRKITVSAA